MGRFQDLTGNKYGRLTVINRDTTRKGVYWNCLCECGNYCSIHRRDIVRGSTKSCGCLSKEVAHNKIIKINTKHNDSGTRLYSIYLGMIDRCRRKNNHAYKYYGGRGIKVCDEWLENYLVFKEWAINNGYQNNLTIDRINVNGNYEPDNCRWITIQDQQRNKRKNTEYSKNIDI